MVVDCGGGTVDITVHELSEHHGTLRELHKATGGPWGSMGKWQSFGLVLSCIWAVCLTLSLLMHQLNDKTERYSVR